MGKQKGEKFSTSEGRRERDNETTKKGDKKVEIASQEEKAITYPESTLMIPRAQEVVFRQIDMSGGNVLSWFIHSAIKRLSHEKPGCFPSVNSDAQSLNPAGLSYYLHWIALWYLNEIGAVSGPIKDPNFNEPKPHLYVPNELAKFLEYFSCYTDRKTGWTAQLQVQFEGWATLASGTPMSINETSADFVRHAYSADRCIGTYGISSGEALTTVSANLSADITLETVVKNQDIYNSFIGGCDGKVEWSKIKREAPDASFYTHLHQNSGTQMSFTPDFDPEIGMVLHTMDTAGTTNYFGQLMIFQKAALYPVLITKNGVSPSSVLQIVDDFCITCGVCEYQPGDFKKGMLQTCLYAGKAPLDTFITTRFELDCSPYFNILGALVMGALNGNKTLNQDDADQWWVLDMLGRSMIYARLGRYNYFSDWDDPASASQRSMYDASLLSVAVPYLLSNYISALGPVNIRGRIFMPWTSNYTSYWLQGYLYGSDVYAEGDWKSSTVYSTANPAGGNTFYTDGNTTLTFTNTTAGKSVTPFYTSDIFLQLVEQNTIIDYYKNTRVAPTTFLLGSNSMTALGVINSVVNEQKSYTFTLEEPQIVKTGTTLKKTLTTNTYVVRSMLYDRLVTPLLTDLINVKKNTLFQGQTTTGWVHYLDQSPVNIRLAKKTNTTEKMVKFLSTDSFKEQYDFARGESLYKKDKGSQGIIMRAMLDEMSAKTCESLLKTDVWRFGMPMTTHSWLESSWNTGNDDIKTLISKLGETTIKTVLKKAASTYSGGVSDLMLDLYEKFKGSPYKFRDAIPKLEAQKGK